MLPELSDDEMLRYNRQIILRNFDFDGQEKLKAASVLIIGLGGLGCAVSQYLTAAGVGSLTLVDFDTVSLSNLQRQILHRDERIGMAKVESARLTLKYINPYTHFTTIDYLPEPEELFALIKSVQVVVDCTDNVDARNSLNRFCYQTKTPFVSGAAIRMEGQISVFTYQPDEPCYRCLSSLFGENALSCVEAGVMSPLVGMIGTMQAMETIKLLANYGTVQTGRLLLVDAMTMQFREIKLPKNPSCDVCGSSVNDIATVTR